MIGSRRPTKKSFTRIVSMPFFLLMLGLVLLWGTASPAAGDPPDSNETSSGGPAMPAPGAEATRLSKLFGVNGTWSGAMKPGSLGPGSPETPTSGTLEGKGVADGFWYACDMTVSMGGGKNSLTWKGHLVVGWDGNAGTYKAVLVDNLGIMLPMDGKYTDTTFVLTSTGAGSMMGRKVKARFTWDFSDMKTIRFTNEHAVEEGPWQLFEEETIRLDRNSMGPASRYSKGMVNA